MINKFKIISLIPAKKNSYGLKNKNIKKLLGLKLFEIAVIASKKTQYIKETYISSDSDIILRAASKLGAKIIKRKKILCKKNIGANLVINDFINKIKKNYDLKKTIIVYLQPTSPFRNHVHINLAIKKYFKNISNSLISVNLGDTKFYKALTLNKKNKLFSYFKEKFVTLNRQLLKKIYFPNGAIYIFNAHNFLKKKKIDIDNSTPFIMNSISSIDLDNQEDYEIAKRNAKKYLIYKIDKKNNEKL